MASNFTAARLERVPEDNTAPGGVRVSSLTIALLVGATEAGVITFGSALSQVLYDKFIDTPAVGLDATISMGLLSSVVYLSLAKSSELYRLPCLIRPVAYTRRIVAVCGLVLLSLTAILFMLKVGSQFSRGAIIGFSFAMLTLCVATRMGAAALIAGLMARDALVGTPAYVIGDIGELDTLTPTYLLRQFGLKEVGRHALDPDDVAGLSARPHVQEALRDARLRRAAQLIVAVAWEEGARLARLEEALRTSPLPARLLPTSDYRSIIQRCAPRQDHSVHLLDLQRAPLTALERLGKRALDVLGALLAVVVLLPTIIVVACAIAWDSPGPVIFRQRRAGFDQRQFTIFKFRTMHVLEDGPEVPQARRDDARVTRVGRFLRRSSLDELPQLLNVLWGDMSLVGPRPHALAHDRRYDAEIDDYCLRHHVRPGITGWAQVNGLRGETITPGLMKQRVDHDLWYIKNWSIALDIRILFRTCMTVLSHDSY